MSAVMESSESRLHRITVDDYVRMAKTGPLAPDSRAELIEGMIINMPPVGKLHMSTVDWLTRCLILTLGDRAIVRVQSTAYLDRWSAPEPDIAVLSPRADYYRKAPPLGTEMFLIIEVSETSLQYDRETKAPLYASNGVLEYWIVDVEHRQLHFFRSPVEGQYTDVTSTSEPGVTAISMLPDVKLDLSGLFAF